VRALKIFVISCFGLVASGCGLGGDFVTDPGEPSYSKKQVTPETAKATISSADWSKAEKIVIEINERGFTPMFVKLKQNSPYVVTFKNIPQGRRSIWSSDFFDNIAIRSLSGNSRDLATGRLRNIYFEKEEAREISFVPVKSGRYNVEDNQHGFIGWPINIRPFPYLKGHPKVVFTVE